MTETLPPPNKADRDSVSQPITVGCRSMTANSKITPVADCGFSDLEDHEPLMFLGIREMGQ